MVEYSTQELFGSPGLSGAEVFGDTAQPSPVPLNRGLSGAEVFGPPMTTPPASASAPPTTPQGLSSAEVFGSQVQPGSAAIAPIRGLVSSFTQDYPQLAGETLESLSHFAPDYYKDSLKKGADYLRSSAGVPAGYERISPKLQDIWKNPNFSDAFTWAGETLGQGVGSTVAPIALGLAGGAAGGVPGAIAGGVLGSSWQNQGEAYKALKDAGVEPEKASKVAFAILPILTGLDVIGLSPAGKALGVGAAKSVIIKKIAEKLAETGGETLTKTTVKSTAAEGITEGLQEFVKQGAISAETGQPLFTQQNMWDIIENTLGGGLVGAHFGAGAHVLRGKAATSTEGIPLPTDEQITDAFKNNVQAGMHPEDATIAALRGMVQRPQDYSAEAPVAPSPPGGPFEPGALRAMAATTPEAQGPGPIWYDKAEKVAEAKLPAVGTAQQMRGLLLNNGVRLDELTWTKLDELFHSRGADITATPADLIGQTADPNAPSAVIALENWKAQNWGNLFVGQKKPAPPKELLDAAAAERADLKQRQGEVAKLRNHNIASLRVTKQEIINHLRENRYELREVERSTFDPGYNPKVAEAELELSRLANRRVVLDNQLDAGSITDPGRGALLQEWDQVYNRMKVLSEMVTANRTPTPQYSSYTAPGERRGYVTLALQVNPTEKAADVAINTGFTSDEAEIARMREYTPPHFRAHTPQGRNLYKNTIAHVRLTLREDSSGQLVAHIEEMQSDWHQIARKTGYFTPATIRQASEAQAAQDQAYQDFKGSFVQPGLPYSSALNGVFNNYEDVIRNQAWSDYAYPSDTNRFEQRMAELRQVYPRAEPAARKYFEAVKQNYRMNKKLLRSVADAPYKMTQDWTRLMLKRVLRWAADNGIQRVTWSNPDLAYQYPTGGNGIADDPHSPDASEYTKKKFAGMKKYYGEIIPSVARDLAKTYGGDTGITNIQISPFGPWVAKPFMANGVVTGWGISRYDYMVDGYLPTMPFTQIDVGQGIGPAEVIDARNWWGPKTTPSVQTAEEAKVVVGRLKQDGIITDLVQSRFPTQVGYIEFDRRAQWNFQQTGFPKFMADPGIVPAPVQPDPSGQFTIHQENTLEQPQWQTPITRAAHGFAGAIQQIAKRFGMEGKMDVVLRTTPIATNHPAGHLAAVHQFLNGRHIIQVDLAYFHDLLQAPTQAIDIPFTEATIIPLMWTNMMHEFGHAVMDEHYARLPVQTRLAIDAAYDKYLSDTWGLPKLGDRMARRMTAMQFLLAGDEWAAKDWNALSQQEREYWAHKDEWFADQVAKWGTTSEAPLSIVEKAFRGIADILKRVYQALSQRLGLNYRPTTVMEDWLNSFMDTESSFSHANTLELQAKLVKVDQSAVSTEEPDMYVPPRSGVADTILRAAVASTPTPTGAAAAAVHASRFNWFYKYMADLAQLAEANPLFGPLLRYTERMRRMHLDESNIHDAAVRIMKDWRRLGVQGDNLTAFINDLVNFEFLTPAERTAGVVRQPSPAEQIALARKHALNSEGLAVFVKIKKLQDFLLDLHGQTASKSAARSIRDPATLMTKLGEIQSRILALKNRPFFPFMRFGRNYVIAKDARGNTLHFETFERIGLKSAESQQQRRADELATQFPSATIDQGVLPESAAPFVGLPPMLLEEIRNTLTLTRSQNDALDMLIYQHSTATKFPRAFKQNYTKGYSMDFKRSFARYFFYAGKYYSRAEHAWELNDDIRAARMIGGNKAKEISNFMSDHLKNTVLEAKGDFGIFKGGIFLWAMGYVPAAATQNLTQTPMITFPYLAAKFGDFRAVKAIAKAMTQLTSFYKRGQYEKTGNREMEAIDYGIKHGILTESQASDLAAASQGMNLLKGLGGSGVQRGWQAFMEKSAWMFEMAEQWNRRIAYRAAYNLALEHPTAPIIQEAINRYKGEFNSLASKYGDRQYAAAIITASYVTTQTQYEYARWARPRFMRGRIPGTLFVFKKYMQSTVMMLAANKSDVLPRYLVVAALMGGLAGIPGYEDLRDLLKALGHWMNKDFNVEHALRAYVNAHFDNKTIPADMILGGLSRRGYGIPALLDLLGSFATGRPGRGFDGKAAGQNVSFPVLDRHRAITLGPLLPVELGKLFDPTDDVNRTIAEQSQRASGAVFSVGFNIYKAIMDNKLEAGDWKRWERAIPRELGDLTRTWRAFNEGRERSRGGVQSAPTIADFNWRDSEQAGEMVAMAAGYQPLRVQAKWDSIMAKTEVTKFYEMQQKTLFGQLYEARKGQDPKEIESVLESIRRFNRELPQIARGYAITQENASKSIVGRERERIARESGVPVQKRNVPISRYVDELFPETTVDVRRVR